MPSNRTVEDAVLATAARTSWSNFQRWKTGLEARGWKVTVNQRTQELCIKREQKL